MNHPFIHQVSLVSLAVINGYFIIPQIRRMHKQLIIQNPKVTHFVSFSLSITAALQCYFDIQIDGKDVG